MALIKAVPKSDATNVFDLLEDVKAAIMEVPARANMNVVASVHQGETYPQQLPKPGGGYAKRTVQLPVPSCGTVGCFAGWVQLLVGKSATQTSRDWLDGARAILGTDLNYLFEGSLAEGGDREQGSDGCPYYDVFNWGAGDGLLKMRPGTKAYAKKVCQRIDRFIERNGGKAVLQAKPLGK